MLKCKRFNTKENEKRENFEGVSFILYPIDFSGSRDGFQENLCIYQNLEADDVHL